VSEAIRRAAPVLDWLVAYRASSLSVLTKIESAAQVALRPKLSVKRVSTRYAPG
jgi:hypothetical protein